MKFTDYLRMMYGKKYDEWDPRYQYVEPRDNLVMSILADPTFPENETDGTEVLAYIKGMCKTSAKYDKPEYQYSGLLSYEAGNLWHEYKSFLRERNK